MRDIKQCPMIWRVVSHQKCRCETALQGRNGGDSKEACVDKRQHDKVGRGKHVSHASGSAGSVFASEERAGVRRRRRETTKKKIFWAREREFDT